MSFTLYHHPVSTCSQKVRLALAEKEIKFISYIIDWTIMEHIQDWYLELNPNGVVPTLVHDKNPVVDSSVICEYLDEIFPENPLSPRDPYGRAEMRKWMRYLEEVPTVAIRVPSFNMLFIREVNDRANNQEFIDITEKMSLRKHFYRSMEDKGFSQTKVNESLERLTDTLQRVAKTLADDRPYLLGDSYTIADIVLIPTVVRMFDLGLAHLWDDLPAVAAWFERVQARPSFNIAYMPGSRVDPNSYSLDQGSTAC